MSKVDSVRDLPKWFKVDNYDCFNDLSNEHLIEQLDARLYVFDKLEAIESIDELTLQLSPVSKIYSEIQQSNPIIKNVAMVSKSSNAVLNMLSANSNSIKGITNAEIGVSEKLIEENKDLWNSEMLKKADWYKNLIEFDNTQEPKSSFYKNVITYMFDFSLFKREIKPDSKDIFIKINLAEHTDKEIRSDLSKLLPVWRKQLKIEEPKGDVFSKPSDIKRILEYRVLALLDLRIWSKNEKRSIPHRVYTAALFPNGEKGETEFKQTVLPFFGKISMKTYKNLN
jgi:hypothetical protein